MRLRLIASSLVLFIIALGFNIFFNFTSFEKLYLESVISRYRVIGKDLQRNLERGLRYGKQIEQFSGMEAALQETRNNIAKLVTEDEKLLGTVKFNATDIAVLVTSSTGEILYADGQSHLSARLPAEVIAYHLKSTADKNAATILHYLKHDGFYFSTLSVQNVQGDSVGLIALCFKGSGINEFLHSVFEQNLRPTIVISLCGIMLLVALLCYITPKDVDIHLFSKKKTSAVIFIVIGSALISTCVMSSFAFKDHFLRVNKQNTVAINRLLKRDVEYLLNAGARIEKLSRMDLYLGEIIAESPEIENITMFDHTNQPLYRATKSGVTDFQRSKDCYHEWVEATKPLSEPEYNVKSNLSFNGQHRGYFSTNASKNILFDKLFDIMMDSLTVIVISMLLFVELLILIFKYIERRGKKDVQSDVVDYGVMRPAAFLFLFGIDISVSFLPLHMERLYVPILNLSKETIMGLPISIEFLFVGIAILLSGVWLDRRGWHEPFIIGLLIAAAGVLYSWGAPDALHFIISRGVVGFGYGLSLMAAQGYVITYSDWKSKAQGLAHLFAGIYAGSICGTATGGMLAEVTGFAPVFLIGALILLSVVAYAFLFMRAGMKKPASNTAPQTVKQEVKGRRIFQFLFNRTILGLIFFSSLPAAIAVIGFLNYFSPIYLNRIGASQSTIGQIIMLYGICLIYFGPFLSRYVDSSQNKKIYILLGCIIGSMALLTFYFLEGILAAIIAVVLLGLSSSFVLASQSVYALKLKVTQELGEGKAIGIFRSTSRLGQMLGPIVFSTIIAATNINSGIAFLGLAYLLTALLFLIVTQSDLKAVLMEDK